MKQSTMPQKLSFNLVFEPESTGGYTVTVPAIPQCITYGETFEEATGNAREAILLCLEDMLDRGEQIPGEALPAVLSSIELSREELQLHA